MLFGPFAGGVGFLVSGLGGLATERSVNGRLHEQRDILAQDLADRLHAVMHKAQLSGRQSIRLAYQRMLEETRERESAWHRSRLAAIASSTPETGAEPFKVLETLKHVDSLILEIQTVLAELKA